MIVLLAAAVTVAAYAAGWVQASRRLALRARLFALLQAAPADLGWLPVLPPEGYSAAARWHGEAEIVRVVVGPRGFAMVSVDGGRPKAVSLRRALRVLRDPAGASAGLEDRKGHRS